MTARASAVRSGNTATPAAVHQQGRRSDAKTALIGGPSRPTPHNILQLQRLAGNSAVVRMLREAPTRPSGVEAGSGPCRPVTGAGPSVQCQLAGTREYLIGRGGEVSTKAVSKKFFTLGQVKSTYDKILSLLEEYEKEESSEKGKATNSWFSKKLDKIEARCREWLDNNTHQSDGSAKARREGVAEVLSRVQGERELRSKTSTEKLPKVADINTVEWETATEGRYIHSSHGGVVVLTVATGQVVVKRGSPNEAFAAWLARRSGLVAPETRLADEAEQAMILKQLTLHEVPLKGTPNLVLEFVHG